jgi:hypothetical protein
LTWDLPPVSPRQAPIKETVISFRVDPSLPWTEQDRVAVDSTQELRFIDVAAGTFFYQGIVIDVRGVECEVPAVISASLEFEPPGSIQNFTATDE